ncbi:MAG: ATPase P [Lachnospiraceae bacterium]|nr:ATPase P [Lachnospiraceae bacterium]
MMCGMCESHMNDCIRNNFDVKTVISSHKKGTTSILSKEPLDEEKVKAEVEKIGYKVTGITVEEV